MSGAALPEQDTAPATGLLGAIGRAVDGAHEPRTRYLAPILLGLIMLFDSWDAAVIAYVMPSLSAQWKLDTTVLGWIVSAGYAGQFIGAMIMGGLAERFGRLRILLIAVTSMALLGLACAVANGVATLSAIRFVQGMFVGGALPVAATYINEIAPSRIRGRFFGIFQTITMTGYACASLSSVLIIPHLGWRWMFGLGAAPLIVIPFVPWLLPESPRWLARARGLDAANKAIVKLGGQAVDGTGLSLEEAKGGAKIPISALFSKDLRVRTIVMLTIWYFVTAVSLGLTVWGPTIYTKVYHVPIPQALKFTASFSFIYLTCMPITAYAIDRLGRRMPSIVMMGIATLALAGLAFTHQFPIIYMLVAVYISAHLCTGLVTLILWPLSAETFPTNVRALALGFCSSFARLASMITPVLIGGVISMTGSVRPIFGFFGIGTLLVFVLFVVMVKETLGRSLDDVK